MEYFKYNKTLHKMIILLQNINKNFKLINKKLLDINELYNKYLYGPLYTIQEEVNKKLNLK